MVPFTVVRIDVRKRACWRIVPMKHMDRLLEPYLDLPVQRCLPTISLVPKLFVWKLAAPRMNMTSGGASGALLAKQGSAAPAEC